MPRQVGLHQGARCATLGWDWQRDMDLSTEIIMSRHGLESLSGQWNGLLEQSTANTVFLTWEWISAWLDVMGADIKPFVIAVRDGNGRLAAVAPFYRTRLQLLRVIPYRCLRVLGDAESGAEYPDLITRTGVEEEAIALLRAILLALSRVWDCLWIPRVAGWTGALRRLKLLCAGDPFYIHERRYTFSHVELPNTYEAFFRSLSRNGRSNVQRHTNRLQAAGQVELAMCQNQDELNPMLQRLYELHRQRWSSNGMAGCFEREPRTKRFFDRFAELALRRGWLRLYELRVDRVARASQYGYAYDGRFCQLQEGFAPSAPDGIGNVLRNLVFRACINEGLKEYDFLGGYSEHKRRWGARKRFGYDLFVGRRSPKNSLLFARQLWPTGKYLRAK